MYFSYLTNDNCSIKSSNKDVIENFALKEGVNLGDIKVGIGKVEINPIKFNPADLRIIDDLNPIKVGIGKVVSNPQKINPDELERMACQSRADKNECYSNSDYMYNNTICKQICVNRIDTDKTNLTSEITTKQTTLDQLNANIETNNQKISKARTYATESDTLTQTQKTLYDKDKETYEQLKLDAQNKILPPTQPPTLQQFQQQVQQQAQQAQQAQQQAEQEVDKIRDPCVIS